MKEGDRGRVDVSIPPGVRCRCRQVPSRGRTPPSRRGFRDLRVTLAYQRRSAMSRPSLDGKNIDVPSARGVIARAPHCTAFDARTTVSYRDTD